MDNWPAAATAMLNNGELEVASPMFYLSVAVGGALGSMARAWLAIAVARIIGPQFPWGTILINIVGSLIIGFFGTLTTSDSRFAVPSDVRAFVMIGICGGFTRPGAASPQLIGETAAELQAPAPDALVGDDHAPFG